MALTVGSLFSGIGGIDLGLERAGMVTRWFVEVDPHCRNVLARHWPGLPIYGDITAVDWSGVEPVDVLAGGFPCQPVSAAGLRRAQDDERWLWPQFARAIRELGPRYVLVENVRNLLAVNGGSAFAEVLGDLAALGFDAEWDCIPASAAGAPHQRDRLWLVAHAGSGQLRDESGRRGGSRGPSAPVAGDHGPAGVMADATRVLTQSGRERTGTDAAGYQGARPLSGRPEARPLLADTEGVGRRGRRQGAVGQRPDPAGRRARGSAVADPDGNAGEERRPRDASEGPPRRDADRSGGRRPVSDAVFAGLEGHERGVVALAASRRSNGDPAGSGWWAAEPDVGRVADGVPHRVDRLRALGNAVVPQVVEWIGRRIVAFDEGRIA